MSAFVNSAAIFSVKALFSATIVFINWLMVYQAVYGEPPDHVRTFDYSALNLAARIKEAFIAVIGVALASPTMYDWQATAQRDIALANGTMSVREFIIFNLPHAVWTILGLVVLPQFFVALLLFCFDYVREERYAWMVSLFQFIVDRFS